MARVAVVTGSNKGIGYAVVKLLASQVDGTIYLTSRNEKLGAEALATAKKEVGGNAGKIKYHQLDITDKASVTKFKDHLQKEHGGLDILVNNAGLAYKVDSTTPFAEQAETTLGINYFGTKQACDILFPLLRPHARVVNVSSRAGHLGRFSPDLKGRLLSKDLTAQDLDNMMHQFVKLAKEGKNAGSGYPDSSYGVSKAGEVALTRIQQRDLAKDSRPDIVVNACCPGFVSTDMTSQKGNLTPEQGADTLVYLALLPQNIQSPKGEFLAERKIIDWPNYSLPTAATR